MNKIVFIIPYFGKFNSYFQLFLKSCAYNKNMCDWIIFTDDKADYVYPENVKVIYMTFQSLKELFEEKLQMDIALWKPYKLCDFRSAYGYIFDDYITKYEFWGECDTDLIWGDFSHFLPKDLLENYDKIFDLGHCTLYRNTKEMRSLFKKKIKGKVRYIDVFKSPRNMSFDEEYKESINNIAIENGIRFYRKSFAANVYTKSSNFRLTKMLEDKKHYSIEKNIDSFFTWNQGRIYRYKKGVDEIVREEYLYIHLQSRTMKMRLNSIEEADVFKIIPNSFDDLEVDEITYDNFNKIKKKYFNLHYFRLRSKNLIVKIKRRVNGLVNGQCL